MLKNEFFYLVLIHPDFAVDCVDLVPESALTFDFEGSVVIQA